MTAVLTELGLTGGDYRRVTFKPGQLFFAEGDPAAAAYIIDSGVVEIYKSVANGELSTLAILKPGSIFGELALVSHKPRSASAKAIIETVCIVIEKKHFDQMMQSLEPFPRFLLQQVIRSLHRITNIYAQNTLL